MLVGGSGRFVGRYLDQKRSLKGVEPNQHTVTRPTAFIRLVRQFMPQRNTLMNHIVCQAGGARLSEEAVQITEHCLSLNSEATG